MSSRYIERRLVTGETSISEESCLSLGGVIVVLAEPGAGKTELLNNLARRLGVKNHRASIFRYSSNVPNTAALVIDALDEVARQDQSAVDEILVKALELGASTVVFASRSYEWGKERNRFIEDCAGKKPTEVRLTPFDEDEQKLLFDHYFSGENFEAFRTEAINFGLASVLGNPMFFRLFVEGYIQGGRQFHSKRQTFKDAVDRLAVEEGKSGGPAARRPISEIVIAASEVFCKILLSGAAGVSTAERANDRDYPFITALSARESTLLTSVLNSRLFRPAADADTHEPVHRVVAEYCAANYLAQRIGDPADSLSLRRCLALIAPNSIARDELRGLLGWLAALADVTTQKAIVELDPYAVLANGDPAQLTAQSKQLLLKHLRALSETDPYFRRADVWRRFNVAGFFTNDVIDELKLILASPNDGSHLRDLILELLHGSPAAASLLRELRAIMLDRTSDLASRLLARRCLATASTYNPSEEDFEKLLADGGPDALKIASEFVLDRPSKPIDPKLALGLFRGIAKPALANDRKRIDSAHSRYYIRELVAVLGLHEVRRLIEYLTEGLACTCGAKQRFQCHCRKTASKVVGHLLDRYFELATAQHDPQQLLRWMQNLKFEREGSTNKSRAIEALRDDHLLRRSIQLLSFKGQTDPNQIWETVCTLTWGELHQGLCFTEGDIESIVDHAFDTNNLHLWTAFARSHNRYLQTKAPDALRARMRAQARDKLDFMRVWATRTRQWNAAARQDRWASRRKRFERKNAAMRESNLARLKANRAQIEQGNHWGWNQQFARHYLHFPGELSNVVDEVATAEQALSNCFTSLAPHIPTLPELAERKKEQVVEVLHAACLVRFRKKGSLDGIDNIVLRAVKTDVSGANGYTEGESERFEAEIDARIFPTTADVEAFAREFIEPTLTAPPGAPTNLWWLSGKKAFQPLKARLASKWIERYPNASLETTRTLFDICAVDCERSWLIALIEKRCSEMISRKSANESEDQKARRKFWLVRHFFFAPADRDRIWGDLLADREGVFALERRAGRMNRGEHKGWPNLAPEKVYRILDAYVAVWPKVYLPSSWGTESPKEETAYRFLTDVIWQIAQDDNASRSVSVLDAMLGETRFADFRNDLRSMKASAIRKGALRSFVVPPTAEVVSLIDKGGVATVEDMRAMLVEQLGVIQKWLKAAETDPLDVFWPNGERVDENTARNRIVDRLQDRMSALNASVVIEHHMAQGNRCDFTASKMIDGRRRLLVCEVKGQWHRELYAAASAQLDERYAIHPDAAQQGIFLALWFGANEKVAGRKRHQIRTPLDLHASILKAMPDQLRGFIDVFVLDLSR